MTEVEGMRTVEPGPRVTPSVRAMKSPRRLYVDVNAPPNPSAFNLADSMLPAASSIDAFHVARFVGWPRSTTTMRPSRSRKTSGVLELVNKL